MHGMILDPGRDVLCMGGECRRGVMQSRRISFIYAPGTNWEFFRAVAKFLSHPMSSAMRKDNQRDIRHSMAMESAQSHGNLNALKTTLMAYKRSNMGERRVSIGVLTPPRLLY